jgi:hypothetical protein
VRAVAESHGGLVEVTQTHPGAERPGARFVVTLPAESQSDGSGSERATTGLTSSGDKQPV